MKKILLATISLIIIFSTADLFARKKKTDYFFRPQVGLWFGPVTPLFELSEAVDSDLGGGLFYRHNTLFQSFKLGFDVSYQQHKSDYVNELKLVPIYGSLIYWLPFNFPINFQLKAGVGSCYVEIMPDDLNQWDPMFMLGAEMSFPAGNLANIGLRVDYLILYEEYMDDAEYNGYLINVGLTLYFNL